MRSRLCMDALLRTLLAPLSLLLTTLAWWALPPNAAAQGGEELMQCAPFVQNSFAGVRHTLELEEVRSQAPTARAESRWAEEMGETPESLAALSSHEMGGAIQSSWVRTRRTSRTRAEARSPSIYMVVADVHDPWVVARGSGIRVSRASEFGVEREASVATLDREPLILFPRGDHIPAPADEWFCEPGHGFQCSSTRLVALEAIGPETCDTDEANGTLLWWFREFRDRASRSRGWRSASARARTACRVSGIARGRVE